MSDREARLEQALRDIYDLAPTFEPLLRHLCPDGCLPTPWVEAQAGVLAKPFVIANNALKEV